MGVLLQSLLQEAKQGLVQPVEGLRKLNCARLWGAPSDGRAPRHTDGGGLRLALCHAWFWAAVLSPSPPSSPCRDIRLIEVTENICKRLLDYNLHKERSGSNRFAKVRAVLQSPSVPSPAWC